MNKKITIEFNKEDVVKVAHAVYDNPLEYMDGDYTPYYFCRYCEAELRGYAVKAKDFKHDLDCPVLAAQDILAGI